MDAKEAQAAIEQDRQDRAKACSEAINNALREYGCALVPVLGIVGERIAHRVEIQAQ
jgi:hypothetical protein